MNEVVFELILAMLEDLNRRMTYLEGDEGETLNFKQLHTRLTALIKEMNKAVNKT